MPDAEIDKLSQGHPDEELLSALEPDQLVAASSQPLPRYMSWAGLPMRPCGCSAASS